MHAGNGHPLVSVIVPTYNRGHFLRDAVDSVVRQTMPEWELIVVDDGSTDDSLADVDARHDARIRTVSIEHSGNAAHARNVGISLARGEWIAILDSDDLWLPAKLEVQLTRLPTHPAARWSCTGFDFVDEHGAPVWRRSAAEYEPRSGWILEPLIMFHAVACTSTLLIQRSLIVESESFDESLGAREDYDLTLRLAGRAELCALRERLTLIREHSGRTTHSRPVAELHAIGSRVFRKAAKSAASARVRRLCYHQCAAQLVARARVLSRDGQHREALASAVRATLDAPSLPLVWRAAAGCTYRAVAGSILH